MDAIVWFIRFIYAMYTYIIPNLDTQRCDIAYGIRSIDILWNYSSLPICYMLKCDFFNLYKCTVIIILNIYIWATVSITIRTHRYRERAHIGLSFLMFLAIVLSCSIKRQRRPKNANTKSGHAYGIWYFCHFLTFCFNRNEEKNKTNEKKFR